MLSEKVLKRIYVGRDFFFAKFFSITPTEAAQPNFRKFPQNSWRLTGLGHAILGNFV